MFFVLHVGSILLILSPKRHLLLATGIVFCVAVILTKSTRECQSKSKSHSIDGNVNDWDEVLYCFQACTGDAMDCRVVDTKDQDEVICSLQTSTRNLLK